jgi:hypothetical protein
LNNVEKYGNVLESTCGCDVMILRTKKGKEIYLDEYHYSIAKNYTWRTKKTGRGDHEKIYTYIDCEMYNFNKVVFSLTPDQCLIHQNGNCFDFLDGNISIMSKSSLSHIKGSTKRNKSSKYHGVYFCNDTKKWWVRVNKNERPGSENCYELEEEAAVVADYISICKYGDMALWNFPELNFDEVERKYYEIKEK